MSFTELLHPIQQFLQCDTPDSWLAEAQQPQRLAVLLQDHLICELKDNVCRKGHLHRRCFKIDNKNANLQPVNQL